MYDDLKKQAGRAALQFVKSGMKLGIGTGSTAEAFIRELAGEVAGGLEVVGVPTSERTRKLCEDLSIPLTTLAETPQLDLTIDGADEIDPHLNLIKGAGGALLREKIVATASRSMLVIADSSKLVDELGAFALPIEVNIFGYEATLSGIEQSSRGLGLEGSLALRESDDGKPYVTDGGNWIVDASFGRIPSPEDLSTALNMVPGVVENGLFTGLATHAIVAGTAGITILQPQ